MDVTAKGDSRKWISQLWVFLTVNYIYCDVFSHMNPEDLRMILEGGSGSIQITPMFLLYFAFVMEIPMAMILVSRLLPVRAGRWVNPVLAALLAAVQLWSIFGTGIPSAPHYLFFSVIELGTLAAIAVVSLRQRA